MSHPMPPTEKLRDLWPSLSPSFRAALVARASWQKTARPKQRRPSGEWATWLLLAGRGFGKTEVGAQETWWYAAQPQNAGHRLAIVAPTAGDLRKVCIEGVSGLLARCPPECLLGGSAETAYNSTLATINFANGSVVQGFSAEQPGRLRGPQHHFAWCDELAAWKRLQEAWDMLQFGLRLGQDPRALVTTTPKPLPLIYDLVKDPTTKVITGSTHENQANLAPTFLRRILRYDGTDLGAQEIYAELIDLDQRAILKAQWWRTWRQFDRSGAGVYPDAPVMAFASVDGAYTEKEQNDETAVTVWYVYRDEYGRTRILLRYAWKDRLEFADLLTRIAGTITNFGLDRVLIEAKGPGLSIIQELRRQRPEVTVHPWVPKGDKLSRAHAVSPLFKDGLISAASRLDGDDPQPRFTEPSQMVIEQCRLFPFAEHDDIPDSVTQALLFIRASGFEFFDADAPSPPPANAGRGQPLY